MRPSIVVVDPAIEGERTRLERQRGHGRRALGVGAFLLATGIGLLVAGGISGANGNNPGFLMTLGVSFSGIALVPVVAGAIAFGTSRTRLRALDGIGQRGVTVRPNFGRGSLGFAFGLRF